MCKRKPENDEEILEEELNEEDEIDKNSEEEFEMCQWWIDHHR